MKAKHAHIALLMLTSVFLSTGCAISEEQEIQIGREAAPKFEKEFGGLYPSARVQTYVDRVGRTLVASGERQNLPWTFKVLNSDQINAFALPGGPTYITSGLLFNLDNEAQLAGIMGHEMAHVTKRHSAKQIQRQQFFSGGSLLAGIFGGDLAATAAQVGSSLVLMKYSRGQEQEADLAGVEYMARAGYDPDGMVASMEKLESLATSRGPPEFFSSHPKTENREKYLRDTIEQKYAQSAATGRTGEQEFAQNVLAESPRAITAGSRQEPASAVKRRAR